MPTNNAAALCGRRRRRRRETIAADRYAPGTQPSLTAATCPVDVPRSVFEWRHRLWRRRRRRLWRRRWRFDRRAVGRRPPRARTRLIVSWYSVRGKCMMVVDSAAPAAGHTRSTRGLSADKRHRRNRCRKSNDNDDNIAVLSRRIFGCSGRNAVDRYDEYDYRLLIFFFTRLVQLKNIIIIIVTNVISNGQSMTRPIHFIRVLHLLCNNIYRRSGAIEYYCISLARSYSFSRIIVFVHFFGNAVPPMRPRLIGRIPARANTAENIKHYCQKKKAMHARPKRA